MFGLERAPLQSSFSKLDFYRPSGIVQGVDFDTVGMLLVVVTLANIPVHEPFEVAIRHACFSTNM